MLHVDADAFFASVALRSRPDLAGRPVAVVAHVYIASANYPARARGVRSGSLVQDALRQCPELVLIDVPRAEVEEVGDALFDIFHSAARAVEPALTRFSEWMTKHAASTTAWIVGIVGFLIARDAAVTLGLFDELSKLGS